MSGAHPHLVVNHVPLIATVLGLVLLAFAAANGNERGRVRSALLLLVLAGLGAGAAFVTGVAAEEAVEGLPGIEEERIHHHHEPGLYALIASALSGLLAAVALVRSRQAPRTIPRAWLVAIVVLAVLSAGLLAWASERGGVIRHVEIR